MKASVIIPILKEPLIEELVKEIHSTLANYNHEIIIVEKGKEIKNIEKAKLIFQKTSGIGNAVIEGLKHCSGDVTVLMDGDFSHRPVDLPKLIEKAKEADIVIGSRFVKGGKTLDKAHRKIISWFFRKFASMMLCLDVKDSMSGFSAIRRHVFDSLELKPLGHKINLEIMYKAKKLGFNIAEVPIVFEKREAGKSKSNWREALRILRYVIELGLGVR